MNQHSTNKIEDRIPILKIRSVDGDEQTIKLNEHKNTIFGRTKGDIMINDHEISSVHCQIHYADGAHHVLDMSSTNGTFVNNERILKSRLQHNDLISIGQSAIRFQLISRREFAEIQVKGLNLAAMKAELGTRQIKMNVVYPDGTSESLVFKDQTEIVIGRNAAFGRFQDDDQLSRLHARIFIHEDGEIYIEDHNSTNGVFVNSEKITAAQMTKSSDIVVIGNTYIQLSFG